jgi:hypothetical protein
MDLSLILNSEPLTAISESIQNISIGRTNPEILQQCKQSAIDLIRKVPENQRDDISSSFK